MTYIHNKPQNGNVTKFTLYAHVFVVLYYLNDEVILSYMYVRLIMLIEFQLQDKVLKN
jgi:hypothetical protein